MKLGILKTGRPPRACIPRFGTYPDMFMGLLGPGFDYRTYAVDEGVLPATPTECDAYLVTGSSAGNNYGASVYEFATVRYNASSARLR